MTLQYRLVANKYQLYDNDAPSGRSSASLAVAFDRSTGVLHQHGEPAMVQTWAKLALGRFVKDRHREAAENLVVISGRLPLDEVNACLRTPDYARVFYKRVMSGTLNIECAPS